MSEKKSKHWYDTDRNKDMNKDSRIPSYYIGLNGLEAREVCDEFDLSYHLSTALTYILRSKRKHKDKGIEDITKAIAHLTFELDKIKKYES
tara:strand:+ start:3180 stop:3452 length:273 start_codon:yes stop_codon:yes gene_type:complete